MDNLLLKLRENILISDALETAIFTNFHKEHFKKKDYILQEGQYCKKFYFLETGFIRTFYYHKERDISTWFYTENQFLTSSYSFFMQQPSFEYIEVLEDATVYTIGYDTYQKLMDEFPQFGRFGRLFTERQLAYIDYFQKGYAFMSAPRVC